MTRHLSSRLALAAAVAMATVAGAQLGSARRAEASQPYTCTCKGEKKRFLASTRHCEVALKLPKRKTCSAKQYRIIYGLACLKQGCKLAR